MQSINRVAAPAELLPPPVQLLSELPLFVRTSTADSGAAQKLLLCEPLPRAQTATRPSGHGTSCNEGHRRLYHRIPRIASAGTG